MDAVILGLIATIVDWIESHGVTVGLFAALMTAAVPVAYTAGTRRTDRRDKAAEREAVVNAAERRAQDELDATHPSFAAWLNVPVGVGTERPTKSPVVVEIHDEGVWVHAARLSWRFNTDDDGTWRLHNAPCEPFRDGDTLPMARGHAETVGLAWPGSPLPEQKAITWALDIDWGLSRIGPTRTYAHPSGSTAWQAVS
jgi:hypothetical protein